jgi:ubiquinone/menaquinone biosynthesis C-methylase UbiE
VGYNVAMGVAERVYDYWEREAGTNGVRAYGEGVAGSLEFYEAIDRARYRLEPFIAAFAEFPRWRGKRVLEIGVGAGSDFLGFVRAGADAVGVDLTPSAVEHTRRRLELEGLQAEVVVADAAQLPFDPASFDLVYSWGVMHHAPDPSRLVREARRVVRPGGEARVMMYGRHSWAAYRLWVRGALLRGRPRESLAEVIATNMESQGTQAYTPRELELLFRGAGFGTVEVEGFLTPWDRRAAGPLARLVRQDWFLGVKARAAELN